MKFKLIASALIIIVLIILYVLLSPSPVVVE